MVCVCVYVSNIHAMDRVISVMLKRNSKEYRFVEISLNDGGLHLMETVEGCLLSPAEQAVFSGCSLYSVALCCIQ